MRTYFVGRGLYAPRAVANTPFFFGWYEFVDRITLGRLHIMATIARRRRRLPAVTICHLLAPDFRAYAHGVESRQYRDVIRHTPYRRTWTAEPSCPSQRIGETSPTGSARRLDPRRKPRFLGEIRENTGFPWRR